MSIKEADIIVDRLKLEQTERLPATGIDFTIAKIGVLNDSNVALSIGDAGIGYPALSYLKHLPID